jgi:SAM-dependent methyltransferase
VTPWAGQYVPYDPGRSESSSRRAYPFGVDACGCDDFASIFDRRTAEKDRDRYRRNGPDRTTRMLIEMIEPHGVRGSTLLDVGGGIGVIDHELLRRGASHAVLVDASPDYLYLARVEARRANHLDRLEFVDGDFVRRAPEIDLADIVTLDRVVCCYGDVDSLVTLSAARARRFYGLVLPRDRRLFRIGARVMGFFLRLRRSAYRPYAHANAHVDALVGSSGLRVRSEASTFVWRVVLYERDRDPMGMFLPP